MLFVMRLVGKPHRSRTRSHEAAYLHDTHISRASLNLVLLGPPRVSRNLLHLPDLA